MSDFDRFAEFLRREARRYNEAPDVPVGVMWRGVEGGLGAVDVRGYHEAPPAPREEMWGRIEAAMGESAGTDAVSGLPSERQSVPRRWPSGRRRPGRQRVAGWAAALAAAASLVLGIVLGRDGGPAGRGGAPNDAAIPTPPAEATAPPPGFAGSAQATQSPDPATVSGSQSSDAQPEVLVAGVLPIATGAVDFPAAVATGEGAPPVARFAEDTPPERTAIIAGASRLRRDAETTRYLGRAETLLTAFRIDERTPASELDLARWARELLIETRMRLDLPVSRTPAESALLEDLELILLQMSGLGSGVSDVEWQLARETVELKGTLPKLRAVRATDGL